MILAICNDPKILELALMSKTAISLLHFIAPRFFFWLMPFLLSITQIK